MNHAFVDESSRPGKYLLTAAVVPTVRLQEVTRAVRAAVPKGRRRSHLSAEGDACRRQIIRAYVSLGVVAQVAVAAYRGGDDQPARDRCLRALLGGFADLRVQAVVFDTRQQHRDTQDRRIIVQAIRDGVAPERLHYAHRGSRDEPLLSLPDAFGWAYGAGAMWRRMVTPVVTVIVA